MVMNALFGVCEMNCVLKVVMLFISMPMHACMHG